MGRRRGDTSDGTSASEERQKGSSVIMPDGMAPAAAAPPATPARIPPQAGQRARGLIGLAEIIKKLTVYLPMVGAASEEGQGMIKMLQIGTKILPQNIEDGLKQSEHQAMQQGVNPVMGAAAPPQAAAGPPQGGGFPQPAPQMLGGGM